MQQRRGAAGAYYLPLICANNLLKLRQDGSGVIKVVFQRPDGVCVVVQLEHRRKPRSLTPPNVFFFLLIFLR